MKPQTHNNHLVKFGAAGVVMTLGIVFGDLGTSPLYVMKAILSGRGLVNEDFILGALSCVIWTLTVQTTLKYVVLTLRADNRGEGGIFSLFALIRRHASWVYIFAIIGGSALLADGIITPSITVVSAVEGLRLLNSNIPVIPIVLAIITVLFFVQHFGTNFIGKSFGPMMVIWFSMLALLGLNQIVDYPSVFKAFNPYYAIKLLTQYPGGFLLLGAVFLATTGAEALYSDLGHCGLKNIRISWLFVKIALILNYLGQGAWALNNPYVATSGINPFFAIIPELFLIPGILIATGAAIIASQALISGSFTLISEAISLNFWPKVTIKYPTNIKGQMYIPSINIILYLACVAVILFFRESSKMEGAYGLSISVTMLMTTILLINYLILKRVPKILIGIFALFYFMVEGSFLVANLAKFIHGGWVTLVVATILTFIMFIWYKGRKLKNRFLAFVPIERYLDVLHDLSKDKTIQKNASNLVYVTRANTSKEIELKIINSILNKRPKRADTYWFLHVNVTDEPDTMEYTIHEYIQGVVIKVDFKIGFKVIPRINLFFRQVLEDLVESHEFDLVSPYESLKKHGITSDFRFVIIDRIQTYDFDFKPFNQFIMDMYFILKKFGISDEKALGLDTSNVTVEKVPLTLPNIGHARLKRRNGIKPVLPIG